jgi:hypothetical protein
MIRKIYGKIAAGSLLLAAMTLLVPLTASAQDAGPSYSQVRSVTIKADKVGEFVELQQQFKAALETAGRSGRGVWQEVRGDQNVFHMVVGVDKLAEYDEPFGRVMDEEAWSTWTGALAGTIDSSQRAILLRYPDDAIPGDEDAELNLLLLRYTTVAPGQGGAYRSWVRDQLVPALKAAGVKGQSFSRVIFGGNTDMYIQSTTIPNWAALDGPGPLSGLSDEERAAMFENFSDMVWESDLRILRYRADLSHQSPEE